ncbi:RNA polymerase I associated factor, A49-like [Carpediemonas membranifera]|uniref:RNA polymerase I associated factor, A49-like n=1 Tax=Carpediemonas membranifera TaxID=201153 RepID=A0A8J6DZH8_9EUKA|nr:RNA polymerase I associated factor, A49-like [Carpediemonas membranifera]|eukprot:KAG9390416.1 RNA polymerase I associated factor, A49-like [Carpediemonas membranifera]
MTKAKLHVAGGNSDSAPFVFSFPQGAPPATTLNTKSESRIGLTVFKNQQKKEFLLLGNVEEQSYISDKTTGPGMKYLVGIRKKGSKEMTLCPAHQLYSLVPYRKDATQSENDSAAASISQQRIGLAETFGSRKRQTSLQRAISNRQSANNLDTATSAAMEQQVLKAADGVDLAADVSRSTLIPPHDKTATKPEDAYPLSGVLPEEHYEEFQGEVLAEVARNPSSSEETWPSFVQARFGELASITSDAMVAKQGALLLMYTTYIRLACMGSRDLNDQEKLDASLGVCPMKVWEWVKEGELVTSRGRKTKISDSQKKGLRLRAVIVALHAAQFDIEDASRIAEDLKLPLKDVVEMARQLGCTASSASGAGKRKSTSATPVAGSIRLDKLPLVFPEKRKRART